MITSSSEKFYPIASSTTLFKSSRVFGGKKNAISFSSALSIVHLSGITCILMRSGASCQLALCSAWKAAFSLSCWLPRRTSGFSILWSLPKTRAKGTDVKSISPRKDADQMGTLSRHVFHVWPRWQAGEWMRNSSHTPEPTADTRQLQMCHKVTLCSSSSFKPEGVWSLYRIIVTLMPKWAWNRSVRGYLGRISDWITLKLIWEPFIYSPWENLL